MIAGFITLLFSDLRGDLVAEVLGDVLTLFNGFVVADLAGDGDTALHQLLGLDIVADLTRNRLAVGSVGVLLDLERENNISKTKM